MFESLGQKSFESFLPVLAKDKRVQTVISDILGDQAESVLKKLRDRTASAEDVFDVYDVIYDLVHNEYDEAEELKALGSFGEYPVNINQFGPVFWYQAVEGDVIGYFDNLEDALGCAGFDYQAPISALKETEGH